MWKRQKKITIVGMRDRKKKGNIEVIKKTEDQNNI